MFKEKVKKILNYLLAIFNLKIITFKSLKLYDLTKNNFNPISTQYIVGIKTNVSNIDLNKGRTDRWFETTSKSLDPAIFAIRNALKNDLKGKLLYNDILSNLKIHKSLTSYNNAAEYLDIETDENKKLINYPWWSTVYPWENRTFENKLKHYPQEVKKNRLSNNMKILSNNPDEIMKDDFENSLSSHAKQYAELTEKIRKDGFKYDASYAHISAEIFVDKNMFCWKVGLEGNHRIAAAAALGLEKIPVNITKIIKLDELEYWPNVKLGYFNKKQAIKIFYSIFNAKPSRIHNKWISKFG
jgi:hypothetical protein